MITFPNFPINNGFMVRNNHTVPTAITPILPMNITNTKKVKKSQFDTRLVLPVGFVPTPYSVIFGRGKKCTDACGNRRLRIIASNFIVKYSKAKTKEDKSDIVTQIQAIIKDACPHPKAAFVRQHKSGFYHEVESVEVREKIGAILRDCLHEKYRSSSQNKIEKRRQRNKALREKKRNVVSSAISTSSSSTDDSLGSGSSDDEDWDLSLGTNSSFLDDDWFPIDGQIFD